VASVTDPADYESILAELQDNDGCVSLQRRFELSRKAFAHTGAYDAAIADYFGGLDVESIANGYQLQGM